MALRVVLEASLTVLVSFSLALLTYVMMRAYRDSLSEIMRRCVDVFETPITLLFLFTGGYLGMRVLAVPAWLMDWLNVLYFLVVAGIIAYLGDRISSTLITRWLQEQDIYEKTPELVNKAISIIIYIIAVLVVLEHFSIEITPFIATLGVGGVAVGLALQDTLKDFFAGVHVISDRPVRVGDYVNINDMEGYVRDIGWRSTRIETILGNNVVMPNSKLASSTVRNNSMPGDAMKVRVRGGVDYQSDLEHVEHVVLDVAAEVQEEVDGAVDDFDPFVRFLEFGDSNIQFRAVLKVQQYVRKYKVESEFIKRLHERFKEEGIEISWPVRKIYDMDGREE